MAKKPKPEILVYINFFYPAYKAGGPVRTLLNMVEQLHEWYNFKIVTSDRDSGDTCTFPDIQPGQWMETQKYSVLYLSPEQRNFRSFQRISREASHDIVYLNSFFCFRFSILPLVLMHLRKVPQKPVILAPRGEFSEGALKLKWPKKRAYIAFAKATGIYKNVIWQASSGYEEQDIRKWFGESAVVHVAPNLTPAAATANRELYQNRRKKEKGFLKILFLSRISPMKNLDGALRILEKVKGNVEMNIYGPVTDEAYWAKCREIIDRMPDNVKVTYKGSLPHEEVPKVMAQHDLFFFPTHGENFGHVIHEALSVGTPVLISDQTPWRDLEQHQAGWDLPLFDVARFAKVIDRCCYVTLRDFLDNNKGAYEFAKNHADSTAAIEANKMLFNNYA